MVLLNLDAGEHDDEPEQLWALADVLCVACGGHTGDDASMTRVVTFIAARRAAGLATPRLGAHPSYPDRANFGRRSLSALDAPTLNASLTEQLLTLARIASSHGVAVEYLKPHGALYHDAITDSARAQSILDAAAILDRTSSSAAPKPTLDRTSSSADEPPVRATVIGPPRGALRDRAASSGSSYLREGFADRRARLDGTLVPRSEPDALITEPAAAAARARELIAAGTIDTICCHADTPGALTIVSAIRTALQSIAYSGITHE